LDEDARFRRASGGRLTAGVDGEAGNEAGSTNPASPADAGPNLFVALQEQIGLKFSRDKGPVSFLIVDHVRKPTAN
jgi:uncharacterized protein (TIGR03435 family)